jgi:hypothetical protein
MDKDYLVMNDKARTNNNYLQNKNTCEKDVYKMIDQVTKIEKDNQKTHLKISSSFGVIMEINKGKNKKNIKYEIFTVND